MTPDVIQLGSVSNKERQGGALAGVSQLIGWHPTKQNFTGSIPGQGTCLGCGLGPCQGAHERQPITVSLSH